MPHEEIDYEDIVFNPDVYEYCVNDKFTCPNYNNSWACPPASPYLKERISHYNKFYIIYLKFDIKAHVRNVRERHPSWREKKIINRLYISSHVSDLMEKDMLEFIEKNDSKYEESFIIWDGHCRLCFNKQDNGCTYNSGMSCRYPDKIRYDMSAAGINTHETVKKLGIELEWPPVIYMYRVALTCFK